MNSHNSRTLWILSVALVVIVGKKWNFKRKFLLSSGALSCKKLTPAKVQNTSHFHFRLYIMCTDHGMRGKWRSTCIMHYAVVVYRIPQIYNFIHHFWYRKETKWNEKRKANKPQSNDCDKTCCGNLSLVWSGLYWSIDSTCLDRWLGQVLTNQISPRYSWLYDLLAGRV